MSSNSRKCAAMPDVAPSQRHPPTATLGFSRTGKGLDMSRCQLSGDDLARLTSEIVAEFCEENPLEAAELPFFRFPGAAGLIRAIPDADPRRANSGAGVHRPFWPFWPMLLQRAPAFTSDEGPINRQPLGR